MRHESGAEEVERNKRIQNMMMRPSEFQTAFWFAAAPQGSAAFVLEKQEEG